MGVYKKIVITDNGNELISQALAGGKVIRFSRASTSDYSYPDGTNFAQLTSLQGEKQSVIPSNIEVTDSLVSIRTLFENADIITPYLIQNIGLYAEGEEGEVLFAICQAQTPDQMPAFKGTAPSAFIYNIHLAVSQTSDLAIAVNPSGTVTIQDLIELDNRKVSSCGGDISDTVVSSLEDHTEAFPVPMPGDKTKGLWGKLKKWQQDCLAKFGNYVLTSMITNQHLNDTNHIPSSALVYLMQQAITQLNMDLVAWKVQAPRSGTCSLNTNAWLTADSVVTWIVVNGICHLHYVLTIKATSTAAELATGMPAPAQFVHHVANEWVLTGQTGSGKVCKLMIDGSRMSGDIWTGTYAGTICYAVT